MIPHVVGEYRRYGSVKNYIQDDTVKFNHILHTKLGMSVHIDHTFAGTCFKGRFQNHPEGGGFDFLGGRGWTICNNLTEKGNILSNDISLPPSPPPELCKNYYSVSLGWWNVGGATLWLISGWWWPSLGYGHKDDWVLSQISCSGSCGDHPWP